MREEREQIVEDAGRGGKEVSQQQKKKAQLAEVEARHMKTAEEIGGREEVRTEK